MPRPCDKTPAFDIMKAPTRKPEPVLPEEKTYESVELVFGPQGRFAGFRRTIEKEPARKDK